MYYHLETPVVVIDGDGSALMHMGQMATIGAEIGKEPQIFHIILNNHAHQSVGGMWTTAPALDYQAVAEAMGYQVFTAPFQEEMVDKAFGRFFKGETPALIEIPLLRGGKPAARPQESALERAEQFRFTRNPLDRDWETLDSP